METHPNLSLREFTGRGYDKGRSLPWLLAWFTVSNLIFQKWWLPLRCRPAILRVFGADVGRRVRIRNGVRVHWPWKLSVGDDCWIGEGAWLLNLEPISIGSDVCLSQEALLCTGSHNRMSRTFEFNNRSIEIGDKCWVAARAIILPGARLPANTVVSANAVFPFIRQTSSRTDPR